MREITTIIEKEDYGEIVFKLDEKLKEIGISKTKLARIANINYSVLKRLHDGKLVKLDLDVIKRICYVLECNISDIIEYKYSEE